MSMEDLGRFRDSHAALVLSRVRATSIIVPLWQL